MYSTDAVSFVVTWKPFFLNPDAPKEGLNKLQYYNDKFGADRVAQILPQMSKVFSDEGLTYSLGGMTGSTLDSHRLSEWAKKEFGRSKQDALMTAMFDSYFCEEKFLGDSNVLLEAATKAGLPSDGARSILEDENKYLQDVSEKVKEARQMRVSGVPFFLVYPVDKGRQPLGVSGAQPPEAFIDILQECGIERPD